MDLAAANGASSDARPAGSESTTSAGEANGGGGLDAAVAAWQSDKKDEAVQILLAANGEDLAADSTLRVFKLSEADVVNLSPAERTEFQKEVIEIAPILRKIARHCLALGDKSLENGEVDAARKYFEAVGRLGRTLKAPQRATVLQSFGESLIASSQDGLARASAAPK
jgi:hypothetical protein